MPVPPDCSFLFVLALMLFPDDAAKREGLVRKVVNGEDYRSSPVARRSLAASMTGLIIVRIRAAAASDPSRASIEQIIGDLVRERRGKPKRSGISRRSLWRAWASHREVAHICAAYAEWVADRRKHRDRSRLNPWRAEGLLNFLALAEKFRVWGESFVPTPAKKFRGNRARPLLDHDRTWKLVPEGSQTASTMP